MTQQDGFTRSDLDSLLAKFLATQPTNTSAIIHALQQIALATESLFYDCSPKEFAAELVKQGDELLTSTTGPDFLKRYSRFLENADILALQTLKEIRVASDVAQLAQDHILKVVQALGIQNYPYAYAIASGTQAVTPAPAPVVTQQQAKRSLWEMFTARILEIVVVLSGGTFVLLCGGRSWKALGALCVLVIFSAGLWKLAKQHAVKEAIEAAHRA